MVHLLSRNHRRPLSWMPTASQSLFLKMNEEAKPIEKQDELVTNQAGENHDMNMV